MQVVLTAVLLCLYVTMVTPYGPVERRPAGHRMVFPVHLSNRRARPLQRIQPMINPLLSHHMRLKHYAHKQSAHLIHMMNKRRHYMRKLQARRSPVLHRPRFIHASPFRVPTRTRPGNIVTRRTSGSQRTPMRLPMGFRDNNIRTTVPINRRGGGPIGQVNVPNMFHTARGGILGSRARPFPFRDERDFDDFDDRQDFDDNVSDDRMFDLDTFDDMDDIDDSFDDRFSDGFGSIAGARDTRRVDNNFVSGGTAPRVRFNDDLEFGVGTKGDVGGQFMSSQDIGDSFTPGSVTGFNGPTVNRRAEFDDHDFKPNIPDFVEDSMDSAKDFAENIRDSFKQDDELPKVVVTHVETKALPGLDDSPRERVPDLTDVINAASHNVIEGFEMLGSRQRGQGSDLMNLFRDSSFEITDDSFLSEISDNDFLGRSGDDRGSGTFALLGIDPGSIPGVGGGTTSHVPAPTTQTQSTVERSPPASWPLDFGFSNDKDMNIIINNDIPRPSTL